MRNRIQKISKYAPSLFQAKIDFPVQRGASLTLEHPAERHLFRGVLVSLVLFGCCYMYFVGASILNVIVRKEAITTSADLRGSVASLEREYLALAQGLGPEEGARLGLKPPSRTTYVHRPGNAAFAGETREGVADRLDSNEI